MRHKGEWTLHDMSTDRAEQFDLKGTHPEIAEELKELWNKWAEDKGVLPRETILERKREQAAAAAS